MFRPLQFFRFCSVVTLGLVFSSARAQTLDPGFKPERGFDVTTLLGAADGKVLVGGRFNVFISDPFGSASFSTDNVVRLNSDGTIDRSFQVSLNSSVSCLALQPNGKILIGGQFQAVGVEARNHIARLNADGSLDAMFDPTGGAIGISLAFPGEVRCLAVQTDGKILLGGTFDTVAGQPRNHIARLNADGSLDATFNPNPTGLLTPTATPGVFCLKVQTDGKVLFGGQFTSVGGQTRNGIARVNADGTLDQTFNPSARPTSFSAIAIQTDGAILIGGGSFQIGSTIQPNIARLNNDGTLDRTFTPTVNGLVSSIAQETDGQILIGGLFTFVGGLPRAGFARLTSFGTVNTTFRADLTSTDIVGVPALKAILPRPDGGVVIGGSFVTVAGQPASGIARLIPPAPSQLANFSTRGNVAAGGELTVGFTLRGSGAKPLLVRAIGPTLATFGVSGTLVAPRLEMIPTGATTVSAFNEGWANDPALAASFTATGAFALQSGSRDAALLATLTSSGTSARVTSAVPGGSGLALVEIYDRSVGVAPRLVNLSTLGFVGNGAQALVPGFVINGAASKSLLIRAVGPGLAQFGVGDALSDPQIAIVPLGASAVIASNDNWNGDTLVAAAAAATGAFVLPSGSKDAALIVRLPPGGYTVVVSGVNGATGRALVEIYDLDP